MSREWRAGDRASLLSGWVSTAAFLCVLLRSQSCKREQPGTVNTPDRCPSSPAHSVPLWFAGINLGSINLCLRLCFLGNPSHNFHQRSMCILKSSCILRCHFPRSLSPNLIPVQQISVNNLINWHFFCDESSGAHFLVYWLCLNLIFSAFLSSKFLFKF